mmetsp:Transcript_13412/g.15810  ORF Transcript_13412/g.15810 Transcript_13412/m.15810 type:complete len:523 (+) Transcript_13412:98-1666(+)|eukprot:CAMPEP_0198259632 /NCGR_PEP_ID=MMETSP1447-20131203/8772_1 /TAXON_ID=420782 /ORGANISM="Chaetoceros dichaeta, Strain CCMP1751" /LENGTH=522 /DNA_ID=CAMNT_0043947067 /DNA_START=110 /DNA_END=1678 /DNA_ORIENTATION=+
MDDSVETKRTVWTSRRQSSLDWLKRGWNSGETKVIAKLESEISQKRINSTEDVFTDHPENDEVMNKKDVVALKNDGVLNDSMSVPNATKLGSINERNDEPINILVMDGGGTKGYATVVMIEEIEKICVQCGYGKDWVSRFDLAVGSSVGGCLSLGVNITTSTEDLTIQSRTLLDMFVTECFQKWSVYNFLIKGMALERQFRDVVKEDYHNGIEYPLKNEEGMKAVAVCASHEIGNSIDKEVEPFLLRTYNPPDASDSLVGTSDMGFHVAAHCTASLPGVVDRLVIDHGGKDCSLADGGFIAVCPVSIAIIEAQQIWPNRKIGCIVSLGLSSKDSLASYRVADITRVNHTDLHYHRLVPIDALEGAQGHEADMQKLAELEAKTREYILNNPGEKVLIKRTLDKLFRGPSRRSLVSSERRSSCIATTERVLDSDLFKNMKLLRNVVAANIMEESSGLREEDVANSFVTANPLNKSWQNTSLRSELENLENLGNSQTRIVQKRRKTFCERFFCHSKNDKYHLASI